MPETKHTPGRWTATRENDREWMVAADDGRTWKSVATVTANDDGASTVTPEEAEANARLISAAPNLLRACEQLLEEYIEDVLAGEDTSCGCQSDGPENRCGICAARAAIAKARGG